MNLAQSKGKPFLADNTRDRIRPDRGKPGSKIHLITDGTDCRSPFQGGGQVGVEVVPDHQDGAAGLDMGGHVPGR
ncbi:hypothetical protein GCM10010493_64790 [Streptomyces lavendulae subsp. grasserius]